MNDDRAARYRKLIRWYPSAWRARNGEAVVATLMDTDDAQGRVAPSLSDRRALIAGGLYERLLAPERLSAFGFGALICAVIFSVGYQGVITWAPGIQFEGTIGPFSNPSVIVSGMLVVALILALFTRGKTARFIALVSVAVITSIGLLSSLLLWLGPSLPTVVVFAGLSLLAASPLRSAGDVGRVAAAFVLVIVGIVLVEFVIAGQLPFALSPVGFAELLAAVVAFIGAFALLWPTVRTLRADSALA